MSERPLISWKSKLVRYGFGGVLFLVVVVLFTYVWVAKSDAMSAARSFMMGREVDRIGKVESVRLLPLPTMRLHSGFLGDEKFGDGEFWVWVGGRTGGLRVKVYVQRSTSGGWHVVKLIPPILSTSGNPPAATSINEIAPDPQGNGPDSQ